MHGSNRQEPQRGELLDKAGIGNRNSRDERILNPMGTQGSSQCKETGLDRQVPRDSSTNKSDAG